MNTLAWQSIDKQLHDNVAAIQHIDLYNRQYIPNGDGDIATFNRPAVFIEFGTTTWNDLVNGVQSGPGLLRIHVVIECYSDSYNLSTRTETEQDAILAYYDVCNSVHATLQGFTACNTLSPLERINRTTDHDFDNLIVEIMEYTFIDYDNSADEDADTVLQPINHVEIQPNVVDEVEEPEWE